MADNLGVPGGAAGPVATDEISGTHHQRVKIQYGTDGSATDVSDTNPLPIDDAGGSITVDNATISVVGSGTQATAQRVTLATDGAVIGAVNETAPGSDTASSGLNGRLQRIAQRLTSLIALLPSSLGQKTAANSLAVVLPSDQTLQIADVTKVGRVVINTNTSGNTTLITGAASVKYAILGMCLVAEGSVLVTLKEESEIPHTNLTGPMSLITGVPLVWSPTSPDIAAIKTGAEDKDLYLTLSANVQVSGWLVYAIVDA